MRKATLINQDWLRSKTMALAGDTIENIAFRLLLISDDFGRFPDDPDGLRVIMNDIRHTPELIAEAIKYLIDKQTVERYEADGQAICCWVRWDDYQNIRWHNDSKYPDKDGTYEVSNNPQTIAKRTDKRSVQRTDKRGGQQSQSERQSERQSEKETIKSRDLPVWCTTLAVELFPKLDKDKTEWIKQALALEQLSRLDNYSQDDIEAVLRWAKTNVDTTESDWPGWSTQFLSCCQLRTKKGGVMKFAKMKSGYDSRKSKRKELIIG